MINKNNIHNGAGEKTRKTNEWFLNHGRGATMQKRKYYGGTNGANTYYFFILKPFVLTGHMRDDLDGWEFGMEDMVGTFYMEKGDVVIYATPFWDEVDGLPVYATNMETGGEVGCVTFEITPTGDSRADAAEYFDKLVKFINVHGL